MDHSLHSFIHSVIHESEAEFAAAATAANV
jgi:hypothetical protein